MAKRQSGRVRGPKAPLTREEIIKTMLREGHPVEDVEYALGLIGPTKKIYDMANEALEPVHPFARQLAELTERIKTVEKQIARLNGKPANIIDRFSNEKLTS